MILFNRYNYTLNVALTEIEPRMGTIPFLQKTSLRMIQGFESQLISNEVSTDIPGSTRTELPDLRICFVWN